MIWILIGIVVLALAVFAFWPRKKGVVDNAVVRGKRTTAGRGDYFGGLGG